MAVYVDDMKAPFGNMIMCHMMADTTAELLAMADKIGVQRRWIQKQGGPTEHFDICLSKRALAVKAGAKEVTQLDIGRLVRARRQQQREGNHERDGADLVCLRNVWQAAPRTRHS